MMNNTEIKRLMVSLDIVNEECLPCHRRELEFKEIKDLLKKYIPLKAELDDSGDSPFLTCPGCENEIPVSATSDILCYCSQCGQKVFYNINEENN